MTSKPKKIYKYISPAYIENVFNRPDQATLKLSLPRDFNDPCELFLTIDFNQYPEELAFYLDVIGDNIQFPTTCFSQSPIVIPMWAHYAQNHEGFVLEFSEDLLAQKLSDAIFNNVEYSDTPQRDLSELLGRACHIGKYRYTYFLRSAVFGSAYFTKTACWSYEQERRMVVDKSDTRDVGSLILLDVPRSSITNIICGARASLETKTALVKLAGEIGCGFVELRIGRSSAVPYMISNDGHPFVFDGTEISPSHQYCVSCQEPTTSAVERCSCCQIDDGLRQHVASRNPYRILDRYGLLDSYIEGMNAVSSQRTKKE